MSPDCVWIAGRRSVVFSPSARISSSADCKEGVGILFDLISVFARGNRAASPLRSHRQCFVLSFSHNCHRCSPSFSPSLSCLPSFSFPPSPEHFHIRTTNATSSSSSSPRRRRRRRLVHHHHHPRTMGFLLFFAIFPPSSLQPRNTAESIPSFCFLH